MRELSKSELDNFSNKIRYMLEKGTSKEQLQLMIKTGVYEKDNSGNLVLTKEYR